MLAALVLFLQNAPQLTVSERIQCANALRAQRLARGGGLQTTASIAYFLMENARADLRGKTLLDRFVEIATEQRDAALPNVADADVITKRCFAVEPLAAGDRTGPLPTNLFERDLMCRAVSYYLVKSTASIEHDADRDQAEAVTARFAARTGPDRFRANGLREADEIGAAVTDSISKSLAIGTTSAITDACAKLP